MNQREGDNAVVRDSKKKELSRSSFDIIDEL